MSASDVATIEAVIDRINAGDIDLEGVASADFFSYHPEAEELDAAVVLAGYLRELAAAAPDVRISIPDLDVGEGGDLQGTAIVTGTWTADLWNGRPTGQGYRFELPLRLRRKDDGFAVAIDLETPAALAILRELGLVNPPDQMHLPTADPVVLDDLLLKLLFTGQVADKTCSHLLEVQMTDSDAQACNDCDPGEISPALRMCLSCGHVGCCDTAVHKHAKAHWEQTGHVLIRSMRMDEAWMWCYEDNAFLQQRRLDAIRSGLAGSA
jgi:hypothetical protein